MPRGGVVRQDGTPRALEVPDFATLRASGDKNGPVERTPWNAARYGLRNDA